MDRKITISAILLTVQAMTYAKGRRYRVAL